ncbi:hypothetical protein CSA37_01180 [Candidatus Fermentibacteria bacterium]|nr:MAG: hypothetical protein CSA37_01180 [Candidatus Fermentibacteria bacterium]
MNFHSMNNLFSDCLKAAIAEMNEILYRHSAKSIPLVEKLRLISIDLISLSKNRPGVIRLFWRSSNSWKQHFFSEAVEVMRYGEKSGELKKEVDIRMATLMFFGTLFAILEGDSEFPVEPTTVISLVFSGIGKEADEYSTEDC